MPMAPIRPWLRNSSSFFAHRSSCTQLSSQVWNCIRSSAPARRSSDCCGRTARCGRAETVVEGGLPHAGPLEVLGRQLGGGVERLAGISADGWPASPRCGRRRSPTPYRRSCSPNPKRVAATPWPLRRRSLPPAAHAPHAIADIAHLPVGASKTSILHCCLLIVFSYGFRVDPNAVSV